MATLNTKIVLRNDLAAIWAEKNPKLLAGEIGIEKDTGLMKIGDGENYWNDLEYANECERAAHYDVEATESQSDIEAIAAKLAEIGVEPKLDDVAIVKRVIAGDLIQRTAFIYNGTAWEAMDGNYSASNVYLKNDVVVTTKTGELAENSTVAAGTSLQDMLTQMLSQEKDPSKTDPSITSFTVKYNNETSFEAGSEIVPKWDSTFSAGSYSYKSTASKEEVVPVSGTGVTVSSWLITRDNESMGTTEDGTGGAFTIGDDTVNFKAIVYHTEGNYALTNLNKLPKDDVKITGGSKEKTATMTSFRKMFAGGIIDKNAAITSTVIRGLSTGVKATTSTTEFKALVGDTKLIFAYPKTLTTKTPKFEMFTMSWGSTDLFVAEESTVQVADKRGGENGLQEYIVYTLTPTSAFEAETKYRVSF